MSNINIEDNELRNIVTRIVRDTVSGSEETAAAAPDGQEVIPVEMSNRHVHLTAEDVEVLFGKGATLTWKRDLTLPGFVAEERVSIVTPKSSFHNVAILGPVRSHTQVEVSATDAFGLGLDPPVNLSGDYTGAVDCYLVGPKGILFAQNSVILAKAHIHLSPEEAKAQNYEHKQMVDVEVLGKRPVILKDVQIRVAEGMSAMLHVDMDEANACCYGTAKKAIIHRK